MMRRAVESTKPRSRLGWCFPQIWLRRDLTLPPDRLAVRFAGLASFHVGCDTEAGVRTSSLHLEETPWLTTGTGRAVRSRWHTLSVQLHSNEWGHRF